MFQGISSRLKATILAFFGLVMMGVATSAQAQEYRWRNIRLILPSSVDGPRELNVQGSTAQGGDARNIVGRRGQDVPFSTTGAFSDIVVVLSADLTVLWIGELREFERSPVFPKTRASVRLPDGQTRVSALIQARNAMAVSGGFIAVFRPDGGIAHCLDIDPVDTY
jgi:hypothetical protein